MSVVGFDIQRDYFNGARKSNAQVTIFLISGKSITGQIKSFDKFTLLVKTDIGDQIIFKHAISNISSSKQFGNYMNFEALKQKKTDHKIEENLSSAKEESQEK